MNYRATIGRIALCGMMMLALAATAQEPLGSSEQFKVDQVHRSLDNVDKDLERIESADREGAADMAFKAAQRNLQQARDRLQQFVGRHADLADHPAVGEARTRLKTLAGTLAEAAPGQATAPASATVPARPTGVVDLAPERPAPAADPTPPAAEEALSRKQKFDLQQIGVALGNAESRVTAFESADRDDVAALALKSAKRELATAEERMAEFQAANPDASAHPDVTSTAQRIDALSTAIAGAPGRVEAGAGDTAQATADAMRILEFRSAHDGAIRKIHGRSLVYSDSAEAVSEAVAVIEDAENAADAIRPFLLEFQSRYGMDESEIASALDAAGADAESANTRVAYNAVELYGFLEDLANTRAVSAETVAENVAGRLSDIDDYSAKIQQQRLAEAAEMVRLGQQIDPNNPRLNRLRGEVAQLAQAKREEQLARIDTAEWPGHVSGFEGPGDVDALARSIVDYLAADRDWGQSEKRPQDVLAVSVTGPWQVAAKDMFGRPIKWRLPVTVAITDDELRPDGVAQAFDVSMVAKEGAPNEAPKSPPWDGFWVGENYYLRMGELL